MNLNKAMIIGNATQDPELRTTPSGTSVTNFGVATNMIWTDQSGQKQEKVEFHNVVAWRRLAEICGQYLRKGSKVYIEGRLETRSWEDNSGHKNYRTEIIADNMIMLDRKSNAGSAPERTPMPTEEPPVHSSQSPAPDSNQSSDSSEEEINVEDIPF